MLENTPQLGDIWYNDSRKLHYLIVEEISQHERFIVVILENGSTDGAFLEHFIRYCRKVS